ncbi:hypothetical protein Trydic_g14904 [Trypoxylus dichotomus]
MYFAYLSDVGLYSGSSAVTVKNGIQSCTVTCGSCPVTSTQPRTRIVRQSSQYEASSSCCGPKCSHRAVPSTSLRQLRDHGDSSELTECPRTKPNLRTFRQVSCSSCPVAPKFPTSRIIRQSSQPEASAPCCGMNYIHGVAPSTSLRQLREYGEGGIAGIAADSLRINGAMRNFRQV